MYQDYVLHWPISSVVIFHQIRRDAHQNNHYFSYFLHYYDNCIFLWQSYTFFEQTDMKRFHFRSIDLVLFSYINKDATCVCVYLKRIQCKIRVPCVCVIFGGGDISMQTFTQITHSPRILIYSSIFH